MASSSVQDLGSATMASIPTVKLPEDSPNDVSHSHSPIHNSDSQPDSQPTDPANNISSSPTVPSISPQSLQDNHNSPQDYGSEELLNHAESNSSVSPENHASPASTSTMSAKAGKKRKGSFLDEESRQLMEEFGARRSGRSKPKNYNENASDEDVIDGGDDSDVVNSSRKRQRGKIRRSRTTSYTSRIHSTANTDDDDDDEEMPFNRSKNRAHAKDRRAQLRREAGIGSPVPGERSSNRQKSKVQNYAEDVDMDVDDDDDVASWKYVDPNATTIGMVRNHRPKETSIQDEEQVQPKEEFEYHIKWSDKAHVHSTWHDFEYLKDFPGIKKVVNYYTKTIQQLHEVKYGTQADLDRKEQVMIEYLRGLEMLEDNMKPERVVAYQMNEAGEEEYLIKWTSLPYKDVTWESAAFIHENAQTQLEDFNKRQSRYEITDKIQKNPSTRSLHETRLEKQPESLKCGNNQLRDFQIFGLNWIALNWSTDKNSILADEMGLGKTVQTVAFISWLKNERNQHGPNIVIVPLSTIPAWADTFREWASDLNVIVYKDDSASREMIRTHEMFNNGTRKTKFDVLLTTYEFINMDADYLRDISWQFLCVDEAHRLKNPTSKFYVALEKFHAPSRLLLTGTPIQNDLGELSALMEFLEPGGNWKTDDIDLNSANAHERIEQLNAAISPYILRRTKKQVEKDLKPKTEKILRVELSDYQLEYSKHLMSRNYQALTRQGTGYHQSISNLLMELRKIVNHPFMFPNAEDELMESSDFNREERLKILITCSGKMMLLDQLLTKLKKEGHRVLIFSQMVTMLTILSDYLNMRGYRHQRLDGMVSHNNRRKAINDFNAPESEDFAFLLSTRAGGLGINLATADTVILFDSDWNPQQDNQAMSRAHRIGQKGSVTVYRFVAKDTIDEEILQRARDKLMLEYITIQRGVTDAQSKKFEKEMGKRANGPDSKEIMKILSERGKKMFEQKGNQQKLDEINIENMIDNAEVNDIGTQAEGLTSEEGNEFLKAFTNYTDVELDVEWDKIIPKARIEKAAKELQREEELAREKSEREAKKRKATEDTQPARKTKKARQTVKEDLSEDEDDSLESDSEADPTRPLDEKELRNLVRAFEKWCSWEHHQDNIIRDAKLVGRDVEVLRVALQELLDIAKIKWDHEMNRRNTIKAQTGKDPTKKDKETVLFDHNGVKKLNGETLVERPIRMGVMKRVIDAIENRQEFRIAEATKPASYTSVWGAREDGMLCVGIIKHGFGSWVAIRDDEELGLKDKFYLEEHQVAQKEERNKADDDDKKKIRSPGAVHLVRRADYLLEIIEARESSDPSAAKTLENHHRNNKKNGSSIKNKDKVQSSKELHGGSIRKPEKHHKVNGVGSTNSKQPISRISQEPTKKIPYDSLKSGKRRPSDQGAASPRPHHLSNGHRDSPARTASPSSRPDSAHSKKNNLHTTNGVDVSKHKQVHSAETSHTSKEFAAVLGPAMKSYQAAISSAKGKTSEEKKTIKATAIRDLVGEIGDYITKEAAKQGEPFKDDCWKYAAEHAGLGNATSQSLSDIYKRILNKRAEKADANIKKSADGVS